MSSYQDTRILCIVQVLLYLWFGLWYQVRSSGLGLGLVCVVVMTFGTGVQVNSCKKYSF